MILIDLFLYFINDFKYQKIIILAKVVLTHSSLAHEVPGALKAFEIHAISVT